LEEEGYEVQRWDLITDEAVRRYRLRLFPVGTIVFPKSGASIRLEKRAVLARASYLVSHLCAIVPNNDVVDGNFLFFALRSIPLAAEKAEGYPTLSLTEIRQRCVPLPPMCEQRAIAHVLRTVQRAKEATERVIAALKELKKSLMRHLFTYGPVPVDQADQVPLKETELGPAPEHWEVVPIGQVGRVITGRTPPTSHSEYWNGSIPFITPVDLQGGPVRTTQRSITNEGLRKARPLPRGAVLVSCIGYIGKVGVVDSDLAVTNQQINAIVPQRVDSWFLAFALMHETALLESRGRMTTVPILHKTNFQRVPIPLPPLDEQREIARMLQAVDAKIAAEQARRAALEELFKTVLHILMTAKLRVPHGGARHP
jgi:type I restriction enzyme S subunit